MQPNPEVTLLALRGLPGSGKSHFAGRLVGGDPERWFRVNLDDLRTMAHRGKFVDAVHDRPDTGTERMISAARNALILRMLTMGVSVIVDETNLTDKKIVRLQALAVLAGADFQIRAFETPWDLCVERNAARTGQDRVPDESMQRLLEQKAGRDLRACPDLAAADVQRSRTEIADYARLLLRVADEATADRNC